MRWQWAIARRWKLTKYFHCICSGWAEGWMYNIIRILCCLSLFCLESVMIIKGGRRSLENNIGHSHHFVWLTIVNMRLRYAMSLSLSIWRRRNWFGKRLKEKRRLKSPKLIKKNLLSWPSIYVIGCMNVNSLVAGCHFCNEH